MNISKEENGKLGLFLKLEIQAEDYRESVEKNLKSHQKKADIKGFRKGLVPISLIKKMYGKTVLAEEVNNLITKGLNDFITNENLNILGQPIPAKEEATIADFDTDENFVFWYEIGLAPDINIDLKSTKVTNYKIKVDKKMIDEHVKNAQRRLGNVENPEKVEENSTLGGEIFELTAEKEIKEDGINNKTSIVVELIGLKTIQKQFIGSKIGDTIDFIAAKAFKNTTDLAAMLGINKEELENIGGNFRFRIDSISNIIPAEVDEELFKSVFPTLDIKTEEEFRAKIEEEMSAFYVKDTDRKLFNDTFETIISETKFEMPEGFLERWLNTTKEENAEGPTSYNADLDRYLRWQLIESVLVKENNINVTTEEVKDFYKTNVLAQYFPSQNVDEETAKQLDMFVESLMQKNKEEVKKIYENIFEVKLTNMFKENISIKENIVSMDEFIEILKKSSKN